MKLDLNAVLTAYREGNANARYIVCAALTALERVPESELQARFGTYIWEALEEFKK